MNVNVILGNFSPIDLEQYQFIEEIQKTGKTYICLSENENIPFETRLMAMNEAVSHFNVEIIDEPTSNVIDHVERYFEGLNESCNFTFYVPLNKLNETNELLDLFEISYEVKVNPYKGTNIDSLTLEEAYNLFPLSEATIKAAKKKYGNDTPLSAATTPEEKFEICRCIKKNAKNVENYTKKDFTSEAKEEAFIKTYIRDWILRDGWIDNPNWNIAYKSAKAHLDLIKRGLSFETARAILKTRAAAEKSPYLSDLFIGDGMEQMIQSAVYDQIKKEFKENPELKKQKGAFSVEALVYQYNLRPEDFILLNLCKDKDKEITNLENSKTFGQAFLGDQYLEMVENFKNGWKNVNCEVFTKKSDVPSTLIDITKAAEIKGKILLFIKPSVPNGKTVKINICKHNDSQKQMRTLKLNTEESFSGWHTSGASIYVKPGTNVNDIEDAFYLTSNAGDEYEADVAEDLRLIWMDQGDDKSPFTNLNGRYEVDDKGNYVTKTGWKLSSEIEELIKEADGYLDNNARPEDCHITLAELKENYSQLGFSYLNGEKHFKKGKAPILIDEETGELTVNEFYLTGEGQGITKLENLKKDPVVPKLIVSEDGPNYIAIHAGGNDFKSKLALKACIEASDMENYLMDTYKPFKIADILLLEATPENGAYKYLPISIKNGSDTLGQIGFAEATLKEVQEFVNQDFRPGTKTGKANGKIISEILTQYIYSCTKKDKSKGAAWSKGSVWCVNRDFLEGKSNELTTSDESKQVPINDGLINSLLGSNDKTVNQFIDGASREGKLFDHKILLNMVKLGRKFGYLKKCKNEAIDEDSYYGRLNVNDLQVNRIHFTNRPSSSGDENTNSIQITVGVAFNTKRGSIFRNFVVFIGSDKATTKNSMMKVMTHENKIFDISSRIVNLLS